MRIHQIPPQTDGHHQIGHLHPGRPDTLKSRSSAAAFHHHLLLEDGTRRLRITAPPYELRVPVMLVRHGQTIGNITGQFQGQIDEADHALNATGREQVQQGAQRLYAMLSDVFGDTMTDRLASGALVLQHSPLSRARDTAQAFIDYVAEHAGIRLPALADNRLSEMDFGVIEGCTIDEIRHDPELYAQAGRYRAEDASVDWVGSGESYVDVVMRVHDWLDAVNAEYAGQPRLIVAFAHGVTINALRTLFYDPEVVDERGIVGFRKHFFENAEARWLGNSQHLTARIWQP